MGCYMTLLELLHLMRKRIKLIVLLPLIFAIATAAFTYLALPNEYTATISMYVLSKNADSTTGDNVTYSDLTASQMLANDFAKLAQSERITNATADDLGMKSLDNYKISVTSSTTTRIIDLSVTGNSPQAVMTIANKMGEELSDTAVSIMNVQSVNILDSAQVPDHASGPPRLMYTLVALLAGLFLAIAIIVIADAVDTTVKSPEDAENSLGMPVTGRVPFIRELKKGTAGAAAMRTLPELQNAAKTLMANIRFSSLDTDIHTICVTSTLPNEGKTTVTIALGEAYASAGNSVLLVEGDMRRRSLANALKLAPSAGLYSVLTQEKTLQEVICPTGMRNLYLLDTEPNIPNPVDILSSHHYENLVKTLSGLFDYVIFDTPPLGTFIDAAVLGALTDGALLVVKRGATKRAMAQEVIKQLNQADVNTMGVVLTFCESDNSDYYYKYYTKEEMAVKSGQHARKNGRRDI